MATKTNPAGTGKYLVAFQRRDAEGSHLLKVTCSTIAEVHAALVTNMRAWRTADQVVNCLSNGFTAGNVPAAMVNYQTKRYGRCTVGKAAGLASDGTLVTEEAVVINRSL